MRLRSEDLRPGTFGDPNLKLRLLLTPLYPHPVTFNHHVELTIPGGYLRGSE